MRQTANHVEYPPLQHIEYTTCSGLMVLKLFSSSTKLSMKFQLLINEEIVKIAEN